MNIRERSTALQSTGSGPALVSIIDPIVSHVALEWSHPLSKRILEAQAASFTQVRLDLRGTGLSERVMPRSPTRLSSAKRSRRWRSSPA